MISFPLIGNTKIKQAVESFLKEGRMPHAILIEGETGTGKHTLANFLASAAVCAERDVPCGECRACVMAKGSNHPDITVVSPEENKKNIAVAQVRELKGDAYIKPHMSQKKVFIIDPADTLNEQSQNALLKVLEEPPEAVVFILIAQTKAAFLETIISRCVVLTLSTPEAEVAEEYLLGIGDYERQQVASALSSSHNNIGKALALLEGRDNTRAAVAAKEFCEALLRKDLWGMLVSTKAAEKNRIEADLFFKELKQALAGLIRQKYASLEGAAYSKLYNEVCELEKSLLSNINLSLLFCTLASRAEKIINKR